MFVALNKYGFLNKKKYFNEETIFQIEIHKWEKISFLENLGFEHVTPLLMGFLLIDTHLSFLEEKQLYKQLVFTVFYLNWNRN